MRSSREEKSDATAMKVNSRLSSRIQNDNLTNKVEPNSFRGSIVKRKKGDGSDIKASVSGIKRVSGLIRFVDAPEIDIEGMLREEQQSNNVANEQETIKGLDYDVESPLEPPSHELDYFDCSNEDTFTLESFESLIRTARQENKHFILARVTTADPRRRGRHFFSFYQAHQLNKTLFRTEPAQGLLHRMKTLNPLNNMMIMGDVHYFVISPEEFDRAWLERRKYIEDRKVLRSSGSDTNSFSNDSNNEGGSPQPFANKHIITRSNTWATSRSTELSSLTRNPSTATMPSENDLKPKIDFSTLDEDFGPAAPPPVYTARYFASDDDFLMKTEIREFFRLHSINADDFQLFPLNHPGSNLNIRDANGNLIQRGTNRSQRARPGARHLWGLLDHTDHQSIIPGLKWGYLSYSGFCFVFATLFLAAVVLGIIVFYGSMTQIYFYAGFLGFLVVLALFFTNFNAN